MFRKTTGTDEKRGTLSDASRKSVWLAPDEPALPEHVRRFFMERQKLKKPSAATA